MEGRPTAAMPDMPEQVLAFLPDGWQLDGGRVLDLDQAIDGGEAPPLSLPDASLRLVWSGSGFTELAEGWAEWLLEARRLLAEDGLAVVALAEMRRFERLTGEAWDESRIGMTVLDAMSEAPQPLVFHSEWWLRSHWGRAFARIDLLGRDGRRHAQLRQPVDGITAEDLKRPAEDDEREVAAATANAAYLRSQVDMMAKRHRHEIAELREETDRELMRRSFGAADLEWARGGPGSPGSLVAAEYEATTSWRLTRPLRRLGAMVRRLR